MNALTPRSVLSCAFQRRLARTAVHARRRVVPSASASAATASARLLSTSAPVAKQHKLPAQSDPYAPAALSAFLSRLALPASAELHPTLMACLTHPSFVAGEGAAAAEEQSTEASKTAEGAEAEVEAETTPSQPETNELLSSLGNSLLGLFASETVAARYPQLPATALQSAVTAFVGPASCVSVGRELGLGVQGDSGRQSGRANPVLMMPIRWKRSARERKRIETPVAPGFRERNERVAEERLRRKETWEEGVASVVRAFVGLIYQEKGMHAAREFVQAYFMSRHVDMAAIFNFRNPKYLLSNVVSKHLADAGAPNSTLLGRIESRVLASSGANTQAPLFNIGLFLANGLKLAEGHGSSYAMAEHRAATNALLSLFLVRETDATLPTSIHAQQPVGRGARGLEADGSSEKTFQPLPAGRESLAGLSRRVLRQ